MLRDTRVEMGSSDGAAGQTSSTKGGLGGRQNKDYVDKTQQRKATRESANSEDVTQVTDMTLSLGVALACLLAEEQFPSVYAASTQ